jgi:hypothetical protein
MIDISFNIATGEVDLEGGDFKLASDVSVQNGGIFQYYQGFSTLQPGSGIGLAGLINKNIGNVTYLMNRWKQQVLTDGANVATYDLTLTSPGTPEQGITVTTNVNYP